jgi:hypothetical protein
MNNEIEKLPNGDFEVVEDRVGASLEETMTADIQYFERKLARARPEDKDRIQSQLDLARESLAAFLAARQGMLPQMEVTHIEAPAENLWAGWTVEETVDDETIFGDDDADSDELVDDIVQDLTARLLDWPLSELVELAENGPTDVAKAIGREVLKLRYEEARR